MTATGRVRTIDGLRGVAVLMVVLGHVIAAHTASRPVLLAPLSDGGRGVLIFFVLSGYLITGILLRERERTGRIGLGASYVRRALRILPAFLVFLLVVGLLALTTSAVDVTAAQWVSAVTFVWNYAPAHGGWWLGHTWSLAVEEQFYLLWPLALLLLSVRGALRSALAVMVLLPFVRVAQYVLLPATRDDIPIWFHTRADSLLCGAALAVLWSQPAARARLTVLARRALVPALVVFFLVAPVLDDLLGGVYLLPVGYTLENLTAAVVLVAAVTADPRVVRVLGWRPLVAVGLISYSLYLWQQVFLTDLNTSWTGRPGLDVVSAVAAATLSYRLVEKPFLSLKERFETTRAVGGGRRAAPPTPVETAQA